MLDLLLYSHSYLKLVYFLTLFSVCCSDEVISTITCCLLLSTSMEGFVFVFSVIVFFHFKHSMWCVCVRTLFLCWDYFSLVSSISIIAHWCIFYASYFKSFVREFEHLCHLGLASFVGGDGGDVFMELEIFLVLGLTSLFVCFFYWKLDLGYYVMTLWISLKPSIVFGLPWHGSNMGSGRQVVVESGFPTQLSMMFGLGTHHYFLVGVLAPQMASTDPVVRGRMALLLLGNGKRLDSPLGILWQTPSRDGEGHLIIAGSGGNPNSSCDLHRHHRE